MPSTFKTKNEFLGALSGLLEKDGGPPDVHSAVLSGVPSAEDALGNQQDFVKYATIIVEN